MRKMCTALALASVMVLGQSADAQNILSNGSLDAIGANGQLGQSPNDWVVDATRAITGAYNDGAASEPWAGPAPTPETGTPPNNTGDFGLFFKPFTGNTANGAATVHFTQDNVASPGLRYILTGWAGAQSNYLSQGSVFALDFLNAGGGNIGGATLDLVAAGLFTDNGQEFDYKQYSVSAVAPAGAAFVRARASMIGATPNPLGGGQAFVVDDFSLVAVPEPATAGLAALGLASMALFRRRK